ncbi:sulfurtransferase [Chitinophaga agri]|uniref:Sulfurtransferase n=1 Tax=Chitinophaga agri TaxID=2703787 RepID=A0A6B9ZH23_9BACT|nr:sulfurtransferase [Chitinophaga agri]QHS61690.1 sulfurtransferase [Chitinophaga agri]
MSYTNFVKTAEAQALINTPGVLFIDCSFALNDKEWGRQEYEKAHIPGALYADLDKDLSGPITPGKTGRHPLPGKKELEARIASWGITPTTQVIAYDAGAGFMAAARLWWLLKWAGHEQVAVLDGGKKVWAEKGFPLESGTVTPVAAAFTAHYDDYLLADAAAVLKAIEVNGSCVIDSRTADRYAGQNETIDPVAGHIPEAISRPFNANITPEGVVAGQDVVRGYFAADFAKDEVIFYCGSGVTAAFNVLLANYAGYPMPKLYAGSWSEWITDDARPVAVNV